MGGFGSDGDGAEKTTVIVSLDDLSKKGGGQNEKLVPALHALSGKDKGRVFPLPEKQNLLLGRSNECYITLADASCSRKHAEIFVVSGAQVFIKDLGSTNGTRINGEKIKDTVALNDNDSVLLGDNSQFKFALMGEKELNSQIEIYEQATRDALTKTYNRRFFEETLQREITSRNADGSGLGVVMFDVDHFKKVNDTYGHPTGDAVLREIGRRIPTCIRGEDIFARLGGEEFGILVRTNDPNVVSQMTERIRVTIEKDPAHDGSQAVAFTTSVGSAFVIGKDKSVTAEQVIKSADEALYEAKKSGRNRCVNRVF